MKNLKSTHVKTGLYVEKAKTELSMKKQAELYLTIFARSSAEEIFDLVKITNEIFNLSFIS